MFNASRLALSPRLLTYSRPHRYIHPSFSHRFISSTLPRHASEAPIPPNISPEELYSRLSKTTLGKKLQESPELLQAAQEFVDLMQQQGLDTSSGKTPSTMQMMKLLMKKEVRDGLTKLNSALEKAGVTSGDQAKILEELRTAMKKD